MGKLFEHLTEQQVTTFVAWLALIAVVLGPVIGLVVGKSRKLLIHDLLYGALWGLSGPAFALVWLLVDTRTSYYDYIHHVNPRFLWKVYDSVHILKPYAADSVYGLGTLAIGLIVAGLVLGVLVSFLTRAIDRRFGRKPQ